MPITRHHSGRWYFQFDRIVAGRRVRSNKLLPKGWTRAKAQEWEQRETARLWDVATGAEPGSPLIEDAVLAYLQEHATTLKNQKDLEGALALIQPFYAGKTFAELPEVADAYRKGAKAEKEGATLKPATVKNRLAYLRAACRWAWENKKGFGQHDPAERMVLPTVKNARHVYLSRTEALRVFRAMGYGWSRDAARVAFYTGWRISEVLAAVPVETASGLCLTIPDSKNDNPRVVPVHQRIAHLVRGHWPPQVTKWTASKATKKAMRAVGLGHARLHDLRHSAASEMVNHGVDLYTVGGVLGHKSQVSTARYAHLAAHRLKDAVGKIGARIPHPAPQAKAA
jgi:integrase